MNNETKILCTYWRFIGVLFKRILFGICAAVHAYWQDAGGFYILNPAPTNCLLQTILSPAPTNNIGLTQPEPDPNIGIYRFYIDPILIMLLCFCWIIIPT